MWDLYIHGSTLRYDDIIRQNGDVLGQTAKSGSCLFMLDRGQTCNRLMRKGFLVKPIIRSLNSINILIDGSNYGLQLRINEVNRLIDQ